MDAILARIDAALALKAERNKNIIKKLEDERDRIKKELPEALLNKQKALAIMKERKETTNIYDCSCGTGRTEFCDNSVCRYARLRLDEYINGPISRVKYMIQRFAEITREISRLSNL